MKKLILLFCIFGLVTESLAQFPVPPYGQNLVRGRISGKKAMGTTVPALDPTNWYVSATGDDAAGGHSTATAWKSITKLNTQVFTAGDSVFFRKGDTFAGQVTVAQSGTAAFGAITLTSYGTGVPTFTTPTFPAPPVFTGVIVSVLDSGAVMDGATNDGPALIKAIAGARALTPKGRVYIPAGVMAVNIDVQKISLTDSVMIYGAGKTLTTILATPASPSSVDTLFAVRGGSTVYIKDIKIVGAAVADPGVGNGDFAFYIRDAGGASIYCYNVNFQNWNYTIMYNPVVDGTTNITLDSVECSNGQKKGYGFFTAGVTTKATTMARRSLFHDLGANASLGGTVFYIHMTDNLYIDDCTFRSNPTFSIHHENGTPAVTGNYSIITNCLFDSCYSGIAAAENPTTTTFINGCTFQYGGNYGVVLSAGKVVIENNTFTSQATGVDLEYALSTDNIVQNNTFTGGTFGVMCYYAGATLYVQNNTFSNQGGYAVYVGDPNLGTVYTYGNTLISTTMLRNTARSSAYGAAPVLTNGINITGRSWITLDVPATVTGTTDTTIQYNAKGFGTLEGNGTTSDHAALKALIDTVRVHGGGRIYFANGTYIVSPNTSPFELGHNTILEGQSLSSVIKVKDNDGDYQSIFYHIGTEINNLVVRRLTFDNNPVANVSCDVDNSTKAQIIFQSYYSGAATFEDCKFIYSGIMAIIWSNAGSGAGKAMFRRNQFIFTPGLSTDANFDNTAIWLMSDSSSAIGNSFTENIVATRSAPITQLAVTAIEMHKSYGVVSGNTCDGFSCFSLLTTGGTGGTGTTHDNLITGNTTTNCATGFMFYNEQTTLVETYSNTISNNNFGLNASKWKDAGTWIMGIGITDWPYTVSGILHDNIITGNTIRFVWDTTGYAIGGGLLILDLTQASAGISLSSATHLNKISITHNTIYNSSCNGIQVGGYNGFSQNITIDSNEIYNVGLNRISQPLPYAIKVNQTTNAWRGGVSDSVIIRGNTIDTLKSEGSYDPIYYGIGVSNVARGRLSGNAVTDWNSTAFDVDTSWFGAVVIDYSPALLNGGFETAGALPPIFDSWTDFALGTGTVLDTSDAHGGTHAVRFFRSSDTYAALYKDILDGVSNYAVTFWAKLNQGASTPQVYVQLGDPDTQHAIGISLATSWRQFIYTGTSVAGYLYLGIYTGVGGFPLRCSVDDIRVIKY